MKVAELPQQNTPKSSKEITENGRARYTMRDFEQLRNPLYAFFYYYFFEGKKIFRRDFKFSGLSLSCEPYTMGQLN